MNVNFASNSFKYLQKWTEKEIFMCLLCIQIPIYALQYLHKIINKYENKLVTQMGSRLELLIYIFN